MEEPSVLDYLKARLTPWRGPAPVIPPFEKPPQADQEAETLTREAEPPLATGMEAQIAIPLRVEAGFDAAPAALPAAQASVRAISWPWRSLLALGLALLAQASLGPGPDRTWTFGLVAYIAALALLIWAAWRDEWSAVDLPAGEQRVDPLRVRSLGLWLGTLLALLAFVAFGGNLFTSLNISLWVAALAMLIWAFWVPQPGAQSWIGRLIEALQQGNFRLTVSRYGLLLLAVSALILFFRLYRLNTVPPEMVSDHAEKLLDVWDVVNGETHIFFPRNTGREGLQMYVTAGILLLIGTGISFLSLKIGTAIAGLLTLPYIYLLGKEVGSRRIGLLAVLFAGIAYWPNVISRVGLRFPLYPLFVAPALYYLLRGIRTANRNDFILSGLALGIGLHGYTPIRILPFVIAIAVGLYLLHRQSAGFRKQTLLAFVLLGLTALVVFLPLLRYSLENPELFVFRSFSRLGSVERPLPGPASELFIRNLWNAMTMFAWDDGEIWVHSVTHRPALDIVSGALFYLGLAFLILRYLRKRHWLDLFLVLAVPLLMLPSILSLAFPAENPALNRMAGAIVPVFLIVAIALDGLLNALQAQLGHNLGPKAAGGLAVILVTFAGLQNYGLVFDEYQRVYALSSWNTSEMGQVIRDFSRSLGTSDTAWVVAYPHWVDTRLVGIHAGYPLKDFAIWPDQFEATKSDPRAKLFLLKPEDSASLQALQILYPLGVVQQYDSKVENHDFWMYFIPPEKE
jgi:4-amino-4-deoxy-L-arabinose transferase-like glycosyltransferase